MIAPEHAAALVIAVALLIGAVIVIAAKDPLLDRILDDELGPRVPAPRPDYEAGIQAMDAMGKEYLR